MASDIFAYAAPNRADRVYTLFILGVSLLFIFNLITAQSLSSYGTIYTPIIELSLIMLIAGIVTGGKFFGEVIYGKISTDAQLYVQIGMGLFIAGILYFVNNYLTLSLGVVAPLPLAIANTATTSLPLLVILGIVGPDTEENFIQATLVPTVTGFLRSPKAIAIIGFFGGLVFLFEVTGAAVIASAFFVLGFIGLLAHISKHSIFNSVVLKHLSAGIFASVIFALFHAWAYSTSPNPIALMESAGIFGLVMVGVNWYNQSTISSRLIHSGNNLALANGGDASFLVMAVYVLMIVTAWKARTRT